MLDSPVIDRTTIDLLVEAGEGDAVEREASAAGGRAVVLVAPVVAVTPPVATLLRPDARSFVLALPRLLAPTHSAPEKECGTTDVLGQNKLWVKNHGDHFFELLLDATLN